MDKIEKAASKAEGWLLKNEINFLYNTAKNCQGKGVIVEIGSFKGKSTVCLGLGSKDGENVKIYAIDPHMSDLEQKLHNNGESSFQAFSRNIKEAGVDDLITPIVKDSKEAAKEWSQPIEFLWIDGDHSYEGAKADFDLYSPFVVEGGVIAFHDSTQPDVDRVALESFSKNGFVDLGLADSITFARKLSDKNKSPKDRLILFIMSNYNNFRKIKFLKSFKNLAKRVIYKI